MKEHKIFWGRPKELEELLDEGWELEQTMAVWHLSDMGNSWVEMVCHLTRSKNKV